MKLIQPWSNRDFQKFSSHIFFILVGSEGERLSDSCTPFFFNSKLFLGAFSRENIFPLSAALHLEVGPCEISPKCVSTGDVITQVMFSQSYCWNFIVTAFLSCLDDTILLQMCWASGSYDLSTPSSWCFLNLKHLACVVGWFLPLVLCILTSCGPLEEFSCVAKWNFFDKGSELCLFLVIGWALHTQLEISIISTTKWW